MRGRTGLGGDAAGGVEDQVHVAAHEPVGSAWCTPNSPAPAVVVVPATTVVAGTWCPRSPCARNGGVCASTRPPWASSG